MDNVGHFLPELLLSGLLLVVLMQDLVLRGKGRKSLAWVTGLGFVGVAASLLLQWGKFPDGLLFEGMLQVNALTTFFKLIVLLGAGVAVWHTEASLHKRSEYEGSGEYYQLLISVVLGSLLMVSATHLVSLFVALELVSIPSYALVLFAGDKRSKEAGMKYILFGLFAAALMLYGMSFVYGITGGLDYASILEYFEQNALQCSTLLSFALLAVAAGALFKISAAPMHVWTPDVYEGSPMPVVSFYSIAPKVAGLMALMMLVQTSSSVIFFEKITWTSVLALVALVSIVVGNFTALLQKNAKRMLAYSSIAHAGFLMIGFIAGNQAGMNGLLYYVLAYVFINMGAFILVDFLSKKTGSDAMESFAGLGKSYPLVGIFIILVMLALIGMPPTSGFMAKLMVFIALWEAYGASGDNLLMILFVVGLANIVISLFFYLKIPYYMYFRQSPQEVGAAGIGWGSQLLLWLLILPIIGMFFFVSFVNGHLAAIS